MEMVWTGLYRCRGSEFHVIGDRESPMSKQEWLQVKQDLMNGEIVHLTAELWDLKNSISAAWTIEIIHQLTAITTRLQLVMIICTNTLRVLSTEYL